MKDKLLEILFRKRNNWLLILVACILAVAMCDLLAGVIDKIWVNPFMSKMYDDALWYFLVFSLLLIAYYILSCYRERTISKPRVYFIVASLVIYFSGIIYSCTGEEQGWSYKSVNESENILSYYATLLYVIPFMGELCLYKKRSELRKQPDTNCSLIFDKPIENDGEDSYMRKDYALTIAQKINNNFHKEGSFVIGITGHWGSGKSSFLNLINTKVDDRVIHVIFDFKPWLSSSANNIITDFFSQLSKELAGYIPHFSNQLTKYVEALSNLNIDPALNNGFKILKWRLSESAGNQYDKVSSILAESKLKILILVDDTDRLSAEEILELFRLVRNTANFPYLQFVITYDRDYLIKTLKVSNAEKYMQKIFNLEISLPVFDAEVIRESLRLEVGSKIKIRESYKDVINSFLRSFDDGFPVEKLIRTRRDVIRFVNALIINTEALSGSLQDINMLDLFKLELIRYSYPGYYDRLSQDPLSELDIYNDTYRFKKQQIKEENQPTLDEKDLEEKLFSDNKTTTDRRYKYIDPEEEIAVCMGNLFPQTEVWDNNSISKIRAFDIYFRYSYDEKNISVSEAILLLQEEDPAKQLQGIEGFYSEKKEREVFHMVRSFISKRETMSWKEEEQSPFYYKTVLALLSKVMDSENMELKEEASSACAPIFTLSIYGNLDYYLEILQLWDKIPSFDVNSDSKILSGIMYKDNLQAKIRREITDYDLHKIEEFLRGAKNLMRMSRLLSNYTDPDNDGSFVLDKSSLKDIQLAYFMKYAERKKVDEDCLTLFENSANIEPKSRKFLWNNSASAKLRELVNIDPQGYVSAFITMDKTYIFPPRYWKPIFQEDTEELERYLFADDKDQLKGISDARIVWRLYKYNGFKEIQINDTQWKILNKDMLIARLGTLLDGMLIIKEQVKQMKIELDDTNESKTAKVDQLKKTQKDLDAIPLYITLRGDLSEEINQKLTVSNL